MSAPQRYAVAGFGLSLLLAGLMRTEPASFVEGTVLDADGPVAQARVGWRGQHQRVGTDAQGRFRLPTTAKSQRLIATKPGYRVASASPSVTLRLERLPKADNDDYAWTDPHPDANEVNNCANCHGEIYREWSRSAHANSATNPKFLHLFAGTDGTAPPQKTWNARAQHPDGSAVCATCHVPTLSSTNLEYDVRVAQSVDKSGIHCDYCHKIADAPTGKFGTRFGRDGLRLLRPAKGDLLTFGPLDDAVREGESFGHLPLYKESRYCASCHEGVVFGVHAYGTYSEWLESPAKRQGTQCQDCHMRPTGQLTNIAPGKGGIERDPATLASHHTPGGDREMLKQCLKLQVRTQTTSRGLHIAVEVTAERVGHRVPTGFPDRQVILVIEATDQHGKRIALLEGPRLPGNVGRWKDLPGRLYAKQLYGEAGRTPVPFWLPILKTQDTRLAPDEPDRQVFLFSQDVRHVRVQLWYRRFWQEVADARGWTDNDVLVHESTWPQ